MKKGCYMTFCGVAILLGLLLVGTAVSGCGSCEGNDGAVEDLTWVLQYYRDTEGETKAVPADVRANAVFAADEVSGSSGCNSYQGPARISGSSMEIGPLATTKKTCLPSVMEIEQAYLANLESAATFSVPVEDEASSLVVAGRRW